MLCIENFDTKWADLAKGRAGTFQATTEVLGEESLPSGHSWREWAAVFTDSAPSGR